MNVAGVGNGNSPTLWPGYIFTVETMQAQVCDPA